MTSLRSICVLVCVLASVGSVFRAVLQGEIPVAGRANSIAPEDTTMTTPEHLRTSAWWPTKPASSRADYAGTAACAACHADIVRQQATTQMAQTLVPAPQARTLAEHMRETYELGSFRYSFQRSGRGVEMLVTDGPQRQSALLAWAFGSGELAQSYLWHDDAGFRESRFNFFATTGTFGPTPGRLHGVPTSFDMALGRRVEDFEVASCFSCHTTAMFSTTEINPQTIVPGIGCEACHGPGAQHVRLMRSRAAGVSASSSPHIFNAANLSPAGAVDACGACHGTPWDIRVTGTSGKATVRFPAYRLEKSRCWGAAGDSRLTCFSCHDPHAPLQREASAYDADCLSCHSSGKSAAAFVAAHMAPACPVATTKCVTCHMPKFEIPDMHYKFTDHMIRVVRNDAPFPD